MFEDWYFTHAGSTCGPIHVDNLNEMIESGQIASHEMVWPEGVDTRITGGSYREMHKKGTLADWLGVPRSVKPAKPASKSAAPAKPAPVADAEPWWASAAQAPPEPIGPKVPKKAAPDWLDDIRQTERPLPPSAPPPPPPPPPPVRPPAPVLPPDWLADIQAIEESLRTAPVKPPPPVQPPPVVAKPLVTPPAPPKPPVSPPQAPIVKAPTAPPVQPSAPVPPTIPEVILLKAAPMPPVAPVAPVAPLAPPAPVAPVAPLAPIAPPPPPRANPTQLAPVARVTTIAPPVIQGPLPGMSVQEVFLAARQALQDWVDADENKPLITTGDEQTIRQHPTVQAIIRAYQGYGAVMTEKLWKHLTFLVENRRRFFISRA